MKGVHLALRLAQLGRGGEAFADGLATDFTGQPKVRTVARLVRLMAMAVWFSATAVDGGDRTAAKITQLQDSGQERWSAAVRGRRGTWTKGTSYPNVDIC